MKNLLADLIALQQVELEIFRAEEGLRELPKDIEEIDSIILARKRALDAIDDEIASCEQSKAPLEADLKENQAILEAADARIKRIKTNKEFLALQREMDLAKKKKAELEEQILSIMERIERKTQEREKIKEAFEADRAVLEERKAKLEAQIGELKAVIAEYKGRDKALRAVVDPALLSRYDRIRNSKKGLAVVECENGVCRGCHMHIQPQLFNELVRGDRLITCPSCQRILYVRPPESSEE